MSTVSVRTHLSTATATISLRDRQTALDPSSAQAAISLRDLLNARGYRMRLGGLRFTKSSFRIGTAGSVQGTMGGFKASLAGATAFDGSLTGGTTFSGSSTGQSSMSGSILDQYPQSSHTFTPGSLRARLDVWVDGEYDHSIRMDMAESGSYVVPDDGPPIEFARSLALRLYDDELVTPFAATSTTQGKIVREHSFDAPAEGSFTYEFRVASGIYRFESVIDRIARLPLTAQQLVEEFRMRKTRGVWPRITREELADQLARRLANPELIRQGPTPLCGPSSVLHAMARKSPRRYARVHIQMYEQGFFDIKSGQLGASESLRRAPLPTDGTRTIDAADWMISAALRNDANLFLKVERGSDAAGITAVWAVRTWIRELLGYERIRTHTATSLGKFGINFRRTGHTFGAGLLNLITDSSPTKALDAGTKAIRTGGISLMMVNSNMLQEGVEVASAPGRNAESDSTLQDAVPRSRAAVSTTQVEVEHFIPSIATHWIALWEKGPDVRVQHTGDAVTFGYFSWGRYAAVRVPADVFARDFFLLVTASPT